MYMYVCVVLARKSIRFFDKWKQILAFHITKLPGKLRKIHFTSETEISAAHQPFKPINDFYI